MTANAVSQILAASYIYSKKHSRKKKKPWPVLISHIKTQKNEQEKAAIFYTASP